MNIVLAGNVRVTISGITKSTNLCMKSEWWMKEGRWVPELCGSAVSPLLRYLQTP